MICSGTQLSGFYMSVTQALYGLDGNHLRNSHSSERTGGQSAKLMAQLFSKLDASGIIENCSKHHL